MPLALAVLGFSAPAFSNALLETPGRILAGTARSAEIERWCQRLSRDLKSVRYDHCVQFDWKVLGHSAKGEPIPSLQWGAAEPVSPEGRKVLIIGALHGDEISSVSTVFRWLEFMERRKSEREVNIHQYRLVPLANPDGYFVRPRTRVNAHGVDLNRNFATREWNARALEYWKKKAGSDPRRFPGEGAASETETKLVTAVIESFQPDVIISVHAPYCLVDHDGPIEFPKMKSPLPVRALGAFPGSLGTFAGVERNIPVVTPELPSATQLPDLKAIEQLFSFIMRAKY